MAGGLSAFPDKVMSGLMGPASVPLINHERMAMVAMLVFHIVVRVIFRQVRVFMPHNF